MNGVTKEFYFESGKCKSEYTFKNGKREGAYKRYLIPESCGKRVVVKLTARSIARSITLTASSNRLPSARAEAGIPLKDMNSEGNKE